MENINTASASENAITETSASDQAPQGQPDVAVQSAAHQTVEVQEVQQNEPPVVETQTDNLDTGIPAKFVGKSLDDVIKAHRDAERRLHELSTENAKLKKMAPATEVATQPQAVLETPPIQNVKSMEDWLGEEFQKDWQADPQAAVQRDRQRRDQWRNYQDNYNKQLEFGTLAQQGKLPGFEDFGEMLPTMQTLAKQFAPFINPVYETHPELLKAVYLMAKGMTSTEKLKKVATAKTQVSKAVEHEKLQASAESSSAREQADSVDPWNIPTGDLAKLIGYADRSVEG